MNETTIVTRKQAKEQSLLYYFTGNACKYGHVAERQTSNGHCVVCSSEKYEKNREELLEYKRNHYKENKKRYAKIQKQYHEENKEKDNAYRRKHYAENKQAYINRAIERRSLVSQVTPSWMTDEDLALIEELYIKRDIISESTGIKHHVDHIIPLKGELVCGLHCLNNLQIITEEENRRKTNKFEIV